MKPRLVKISGIWHCGVRGNRNVLGLGFKVKEAYADWQYFARLEWMP